MSPASIYQSKNFTISYYQSLPRGGAFLGQLDIAAQAWKHSITAFGGFDSASFTVIAPASVLDDWVLNGIGRTIVMTDNALEIVWEGFVDSITINQAGLSVTHGPLTNVTNRVFAVYSGVDTSVYPPEIGVRKKTPTVNNTKSQADWGIWPTILSLAGVTDANADQLISQYLSEHSEPEMGNSNFSFGRSDLSITVNCLGWIHTLKYPYNYTALSGTIFISTRIKEILLAQPNVDWVSPVHTKIDLNETLVPRYENDDQLAMELIKGYTAMGDEDNNRHNFGIYENRQPVYGMASQQIDYDIQLADPKQQILDTAGAIVSPWRVRPGKWIFFSDFMPGLGAPNTNLHEDPRMMQIETVTFDLNTPFAVQFTSSTYSGYEHKLARLGLRGMNA